MEFVDGATTGGVVIVVLAAFKMVEKFMPTKGSANNGNKVMAKQVDEIHGWYGPKGPMERMTEQMEQVKDESIAQTIVLRDILTELKKD